MFGNGSFCTSSRSDGLSLAVRFNARKQTYQQNGSRQRPLSAVQASLTRRRFYSVMYRALKRTAKLNLSLTRQKDQAVLVEPEPRETLSNDESFGRNRARAGGRLRNQVYRQEAVAAQMTRTF